MEDSQKFEMGLMFASLYDVFDTEILSFAQVGQVLEAWRENFCVETLDFYEFKDARSRHDRFFKRRALSHLNSMSSQDFYVFSRRIPLPGGVRCGGREATAEELYEIHKRFLGDFLVFDAEFNWCLFIDLELNLAVAR